MNQMIKICKSYLILLPLIMACSFISPDKVERMAPVEATANWFKVPERFSFNSLEGELLIHPFFDLVPFSSREDNGVNFVALNAAGSRVAYEFDLLSGRSYFIFPYCHHIDIWKSYLGLISAPPYTEGIVPRLVDQLGQAQKIIVFGADNYYQSLGTEKFRISNRVRVVGGVVEQYCQDHPCNEDHTWLARLILVAVDPQDKKFSDVFELEELKKVVSWNYVRAFLQNGKGHTHNAAGVFPAYRLIGTGLSAKDALKTARDKGHLFKFEELQTMQRSCHKLYDYLWDETEKIRKTSGKFAPFFYKFYTKFLDRYMTCAKYVRMSSINNDLRRHWFFAFITGFFKLDQLGHIYQCSAGNWVPNPYLPNGKRVYDAALEYKTCKTEQLNSAFDQIPVALTGLVQGEQTHFKYLEYDDVAGGSHQKIYSWVDISGKRLRCNEKISSTIFPKDISWERFIPKN